MLSRDGRQFLIVRGVLNELQLSPFRSALRAFKVITEFGVDEMKVFEGAF
jgi:hypothetical protein